MSLAMSLEEKSSTEEGGMNCVWRKAQGIRSMSTQLAARMQKYSSNLVGFSEIIQ
jgi:hypothetical protein